MVNTSGIHMRTFKIKNVIDLHPRVAMFCVLMVSRWLVQQAHLVLIRPFWESSHQVPLFLANLHMHLSSYHSR